MSPADLGRILLRSVLRIMDKEIRAIDEDSVSLILPRDLALASRQYPRIRFVITRIDDGYPVGLQSIAERECGMVEVMSRDFDVVNVQGTLDKVVIVNPRPTLIERNREIGVLHLPS